MAQQKVKIKDVIAGGLALVVFSTLSLIISGLFVQHFFNYAIANPYNLVPLTLERAVALICLVYALKLNPFPKINKNADNKQSTTNIVFPSITGKDLKNAKSGNSDSNFGNA